MERYASSMVYSLSILVFIDIIFFFFFFNDTATTEIYTLSLHDALPISLPVQIHPTTNSTDRPDRLHSPCGRPDAFVRSEEHTSELQSPCNLVCRLLLGKRVETYVVVLTPLVLATRQSLTRGVTAVSAHA